MVLFWIILIVFLVMLALPIYVGMKTAGSKSETLFIPQSNTRHPRYFSISFKKIVERALESYDGFGILRMSKDEEVIEADKIELIPNQICSALVYAENNNFVPKEGISFDKEIYCKKNARLEKIPILRAIACRMDLVLGSGTQVMRWADAEGTLTARKNCDLGLSTTSATKLFIGKNCSFKRLYAPEIWLGLEEPEFHGYKDFNMPNEVVINPEIIRNIEYVDDEIVDEDGILPKTIITKYNLRILGNYVVQGHIRSHKDIKIDSNAVVHGNVFAEGNIFIGSNAIVLGVVFTQENIYVDDGAIVGQPNKIKSVVARGNIEFGSNCRVYGYIGAEGTGMICPKIERDEEFA